MGKIHLCICVERERIGLGKKIDEEDAWSDEECMVNVYPRDGVYNLLVLKVVLFNR